MNILRIVIFALACLLTPAGPARSQNSDGELVAIPVRPEVGQAWLVNVLREKTTVSGEKVTSDRSARIIGKIEVTGVSESGYDIVWTTRSVSEGAIVIEYGYIDPRLTIGLPVDGHLDVFGSPVELKDWDALREGLFANLGKHSVGYRKENLFRDMIGSWNASIAAKFLLNNVSALSMCQGAELVVGSPVQATEMVPSPIGGTALQANSTYTLQSVDSAEGVARIRVERKLDPDSLAKGGKELLESIAGQTGQDTSEMIDLLGAFELVSDFSADCVVDLETGFTTGIDHEFTFVIGSEQAHEVRRIRLLPRSGSR